MLLLTEHLQPHSEETHLFKCPAWGFSQKGLEENVDGRPLSWRTSCSSQGKKKRPDSYQRNVHIQKGFISFGQAGQEPNSSTSNSWGATQDYSTFSSSWRCGLPAIKSRPSKQKHLKKNSERRSFINQLIQACSPAGNKLPKIYLHRFRRCSKNKKKEENQGRFQLEHRELHWKTA